MARTLRRDPFARQTLMSEIVITPSGICHWCGREATLRNYWWEPDPIKRLKPLNLKPFCSVSCFEDYYK